MEFYQDLSCNLIGMRSPLEGRTLYSELFWYITLHSPTSYTLLNLFLQNCLPLLQMSLTEVVFSFCSSSVQFSRVWLFATPWTAESLASLSITSSRSLLRLITTESVMPSNHLILFRPLLLLPSVIPNELVLCIGWPSIGISASASVLPLNIQDWFPLGWTGCISLLPKGLLRVFSNTTAQKHQFFGAQLSL